MYSHRVRYVEGKLDMDTLKKLLVLVVLAIPAQAGELLGALKLTNADGDGIATVTAVSGKQEYPLLSVVEPLITSPLYAIRGMIRYEGVEGDAYLNMNNDFGDYGSFFTRSRAQIGPMKTITGDSDWREFVMPFNADSGRMSLIPERLTLTLVLPGPGTVYIRDLSLYQYDPDENPLETAGQ